MVCRPIEDLFYDEGYIYLSNIEPTSQEEITFRLRTVKDNVTAAYLEISRDTETMEVFPMHYEKNDANDRFSFFKVVLPPQKQDFKYRFRCENQKHTVWYGVQGVTQTPPSFVPGRFVCDCWTMLVDFHTPDWAKGVLWYSLMTDGFYNGDTTNDEPLSGENYANSWNNVRHELLDRYGGDLKGVREKIPYLRDLGIESVYMNPVFKTTQNAGYGPNHYKEIENAFGNKQAFAELCQEIHKNGMKIIMETVFGFVEPDSPWYNLYETSPFPGACQDWNSPYHEFFMFTGEEGDTKAYRSRWGGVEQNHANENLAKQIYSEKDSFLQYYSREPFCLDGVRFDTGGELYGIKEDGTLLEDPDVVGRIRPYLKDINRDFLIQSEYSAHKGITGRAWDSRWNLNFVSHIRKYMTGEVPQSWLLYNFQGEIYDVPRSIALCQYNSLTDHDRPRVHIREKYLTRPARLIQMTMLGAPCIFFGEEIELIREDYGSSFYSMEWNEDHWDYETLSFIRSLIELRKCVPTLRTGIQKVMVADEPNHILAFARQDEKGTVITIANKNPFPFRLAVDAADLCETDGTLFTDWLTGLQYKVSGGYIELDVPAGGTVLVKGEGSATHKAGFMMSRIGGGTAQVQVTPDGTLHVNGQGSTEDDFVFINRDVFHTCTVSARAITSQARIMVQVRSGLEKDRALVSVRVENGKATVCVRRKDGGKLITHKPVPVQKDSYILIERKGDNTFRIMTTRTLGTPATLLAEVHADMDCHAKAGFGVIGSGAIADPVVKFARTPVLADNFRAGKTAMFDYGKAAVRFTTEGMVLTPEQGYAHVLSYAGKNDWTFKSRIKCAEEAGVIAWQDENNFVMAGRGEEQGKRVFFLARAMNGKPVVYHTIADTQPNHRATIQLQRIGTTYSAVVSYNEKTWRRLGKAIIANLCVARAGVYAKGQMPASFQYACFGDAIHDGKSIHTPMTPGKIPIDTSCMEDVKKRTKYRIVSGDWSLADEGYLQSSKGIGQMGIAEKTYGDFRFDGTYNIESGQGFVGFEFGKKQYDAPLGDGVLFSLDHQRQISLYRGTEVLACTRVDEKYGEFIRLAVDYKDDILTVCAGLEAEPILVVRDLKVKRGYAAYFTKGVAAHINNSIAASNETSLYQYRPFEYFKDGLANKWGVPRSFASLFGVGVTEFVLSLRVTPDKNGIRDRAAYAAVCFCGHEGKFYTDMAWMLRLDGRNELGLYNGEKKLCACTLTQKPFHDLMIVKEGRRIAIYADAGAAPVLTYEEPVLRGGVISFYSANTKAAYTRLRLEDLKTEAAKTATFRRFVRGAAQGRP